MPEIAEILTESKINKTEITDIVVAEGQVHIPVLE